MRILFIHQNFPGQFRYLAPALQKAGHDVLALAEGGRGLPNVPLARYQRPSLKINSPLISGGMERDVHQGIYAAIAMERLRDVGYHPDIIIAHPGWGEALFVKDVWRSVRLIVFAEYYFWNSGGSYGFDREWHHESLLSRASLRLRNHTLQQALTVADLAWVPTQWQHSLLPSVYKEKTSVVFDGVDTTVVRPNPDATFSFQPPTAEVRSVLNAADEVITFINRNLEPERGFHIFMRALPAILNKRPNAHCVIVGGDERSYSPPPPKASGHHNWRSFMMGEIGERLPMDRVHFVGKLAYGDYLSLLQISSCHVYLTYPFVLGWSCVEALASGCLVVGSNTPPVREFISHKINGLLVDFFDIDGLACSVIDVLENPDKYMHLRQAARRLVVEKYDLPICLNKQFLLLKNGKIEMSLKDSPEGGNEFRACPEFCVNGV